MATNNQESIMLVIMTGQRMKVVAGDNKDAGDRDESEIDNPDSNKMSPRTFETQATSSME